MDKNFWRSILAACVIGVLGDGHTTMAVLLGLFAGADFLGWIYGIAGAIFVTVLTANHRATFGSASPGYMKIMGAIAFLVDILTAFVGATYFIALKNPIGQPIDFTQMTCCDFDNLYPTLAAFGVGTLLFFSTTSIVDVYNRYRAAN